jgi:cysteine-rich repeat protein
MTRPFRHTKGILAIATVFASAAMINCNKSTSNEANGEVGAVGLALKLPSGQHIDKVHYKLTGGPLTAPREADVNVAGEATTFSFLIPSVAAGMGYKLELSADTNETPLPLTNCLGSKDMINVTAGVVSSVDIGLVCRGSARKNGGILVNGSIKDTCPTISEGYGAERTTVNVGETLNLSANGTDPDAADVLTFSWSVADGSGTFAPSTGKGKNVAFTCTLPGKHIVTLSLSDGTTGCDDSVAVEINCISFTCGNGMLDMGEACDVSVPGHPANCRANCTLAVCGDGLIDTSLGETCDDHNTTSNDGCSATCKTESCGDGIVQTGEACDSGANNGTAGNRCSATCKVNAVCGDGIIDAPESCDPPNGTTCSTTCMTMAPPPMDACNTCDSTNTNSNCKPLFTAVQANADAKALLACIHSTRCDQIPSSGGNPDGAICFCGANYDLAVCSGGGAQPGPCATAYYKLVGVTNTGASITPTDNKLVTDNFLDPNLPVGKVDILVQKCEEFATRCAPSCSTATP